MNVTIDTNIIFQDFNLNSLHFKVFLEHLDTIPATLHISEVVIDEVVNKYRENLLKSITEIERSESSLRKLGIELEVKLPEINKTVQNYRKSLLEKLKVYNVEILKYPEPPHNIIFQRIFEKKLPFRGGEKGYRDFLIWESIKKLVLWGHEQVIFLTNNTTDFGSGKNVSEEYKDRFSRPENFRIITSISKFNEEFIIPKRTKLDELREKLQKNQIKNFEIKNWINNRLIDLMRDLELEDVLMGFPLGAGSIWATEIIEIHEFDVQSVREIRNNEKLIRFQVSLKVAISVDIDWEDYLKYEEIREYIGEVYGEFSSSSGYSDVDIVVHGFVVIDSNSELINEELVRIDGPYGTYEIEY